MGASQLVIRSTSSQFHVHVSFYAQPLTSDFCRTETTDNGTLKLSLSHSRFLKMVSWIWWKSLKLLPSAVRF